MPCFVSRCVSLVVGANLPFVWSLGEGSRRRTLARSLVTRGYHGLPLAWIVRSSEGCTGHRRTEVPVPAWDSWTCGDEMAAVSHAGSLNLRLLADLTGLPGELSRTLAPASFTDVPDRSGS